MVKIDRPRRGLHLGDAAARTALYSARPSCLAWASAVTAVHACGRCIEQSISHTFRMLVNRVLLPELSLMRCGTQLYASREYRVIWSLMCCVCAVGGPWGSWLLSLRALGHTVRIHDVMWYACMLSSSSAVGCLQASYSLVRLCTAELLWLCSTRTKQLGDQGLTGLTTGAGWPWSVTIGLPTSWCLEVYLRTRCTCTKTVRVNSNRIIRVEFNCDGLQTSVAH